MTANRSDGRRRRVWLWGLAAAVVVLAWCGYWYASNRVVASAIADVAAGIAEDGRTIDCDERAIGGFPLTLELECREARFSDAEGRLSAVLAGVSASAPLYWPGHVTAAISGPMVVGFTGDAPGLRASWSDGDGAAQAGIYGLSAASAGFDEVVIEPFGDGDPSLLPFSRITAGRAETSTRPESAGDYRLLAAATDVVVERPGGRSYPTVSGFADLVARDLGAGLGMDPVETFTDWLAEGGSMAVERLVVSSEGVSAAAAGTLEISAGGVISGDLTIRLVGLEDLPSLAAKFRRKYRDTAEQAIGVITAFSKPVEGQPEARDLPLTIRNGVVSVGVLPVMSLPPLTF